MTDREEVTGLWLADGTYDQAQEWVGRTSETRYAAEPVNQSMIRFYASLLEDPNPVYWDERTATDHWGDVVSPPGMLMTWKMPPQWVPAYYPEPAGVMYATEVPLPAEMDTVINVKTESTFYRPMLAGDCLNWQETILSVSEEKRTRLGVGHFIVSKSTFRSERGEPVAENVNTLFRYTSPGPKTDVEDVEVANGRRIVEVDEPNAGRDPTTMRSIDGIGVGDAVTPYEYGVTYRTVIHGVAATRDFFPGHHDPEYARMQRNETIYLNTMVFQGLVDRLVLGWAGPGWRIAERTVEMEGSAEAGDLLELRGDVTDVSGGVVEVDASVFLDDCSICSSSVSVTRDVKT